MAPDMRYKLSYRFSRSGGNVQYKTKQQAQRVTEAVDRSELVSTGLSLAADAVVGHAYIDVPEETDPETAFADADTVEELTAGESPMVGRQLEQRGTVVEKEGVAEAAVQRFETNREATDILDRVNQSGGGGFIRNADLTPCDPFSIDRWFAVRKEFIEEREAPLTRADIGEFYRAHSEDLTKSPETQIDAYLVAYRSPNSQTVTLSIASTCSKSQLMASAQHGAGWARVSNVHRFDCATAALVVGEETHGPSHVEARFKNDEGDIQTGRALAYHDWWGEMDVDAHPLGLLVDGDLYHPAAEEWGGLEFVGAPVQLRTHRGSTSTPWQFGLTRSDGEMLLTMARAGPEKFDPVLKRFEISEYAIGDDPLVVSSTVSRRLWKEDPTNPAVTSSHTDGEQVRLLYRNATGWHLSKPDPSDGFPDAGDDTSFVETNIPGVEVHSTGIQTVEDGDRKSTIEREYRITEPFVDDHVAAYVLVYHEHEEESMETLEWKVSDATAYELQSESAGIIPKLDGVEEPAAVPRDQYIEAIQATREYIHHNDGATKQDVIGAFEPEQHYPLGHNGYAAQAKGFVPQFRDMWWDDVVRGLVPLSDVAAIDDQCERWKSSIGCQENKRE